MFLNKTSIKQNPEQTELPNLNATWAEKPPAMRVLLAEDETLIRLMAAEYLQEKGFEVVEARDGDEAVRLLDGPGSFDALFTDVRMPGTLDGLDVALHARRRHPGIPVLVVSGYAVHLASRLDALQPSAAFISKPYSLAEVADVLNRLTVGF